MGYSKMIIDKIENIDLYTNIPNCAMDFIKSLTPHIQLGKYNLSDGIYVNVETYTPKSVCDARFESHKKFIDIQITLDSCEYIYVEDVQKLSQDIPYNKEKDITFYKDNIENSYKYKLNGTNFIMLYPHEAHAPQVAFDKSCDKVKKVVVKIPYDL